MKKDDDSNDDQDLSSVPPVKGAYRLPEGGWMLEGKPNASQDKSNFRISAIMKEDIDPEELGRIFMRITEQETGRRNC